MATKSLCGCLGFCIEGVRESMLKIDVKKPRKFISPLLSKHSMEKAHFERFKDELSKLKRVNRSEIDENTKGGH